MCSRRPKLSRSAKRPRNSGRKGRLTSRLPSGCARAIGQPTQSWYRSLHRARSERWWRCTSTTSLLEVRCGTSIPSISGEWNWARCWRRELFRSSRAHPPHSSSTTAPPTTLSAAIGTRSAGNERRRRHGTLLGESVVLQATQPLTQPLRNLRFRQFNPKRHGPSSDGQLHAADALLLLVQTTRSTLGRPSGEG